MNLSHMEEQSGYNMNLSQMSHTTLKMKQHQENMMMAQSLMDSADKSSAAQPMSVRPVMEAPQNFKIQQKKNSLMQAIPPITDIGFEEVINMEEEPLSGASNEGIQLRPSATTQPQSFPTTSN